MSGGFLVDVPAPEQLITTLSEAAERMHAASDRLRAASAADLGSSDLDHATGDLRGYSPIRVAALHRVLQAR